MRITVTLLLAGTFLLSSCTQNNVEEDLTVQKYFSEKGLLGTFGLFDNGHGTFTIYGLKDFSIKKQPPGQTYHLVAALIGLETGAIADATTHLFQDTSSKECSQFTDLQHAFQNGCDNWFVQLNQSMNKTQLEYVLDTLGYASGKSAAALQGINGPFWKDTSVMVTADEQLGLVKKLYFNKLPLLKRTQEEVKKIMIKESNPNYTLCHIAGGGWIIGWIEENQHPYFFSLYAKENSGSAATNSQLKDLLSDILSHYGFYQGKK